MAANFITVAQVLEHGTLGAAYFKQLVKDGVPEPSAMELTAKYVTTLICIVFNTPPKEEWET